MLNDSVLISLVELPLEVRYYSIHNFFLISNITLQRSIKCILLVVTCAKIQNRTTANQRQHTNLCRATSSEWNFSLEGERNRTRQDRALLVSGCDVTSKFSCIKRNFLKLFQNVSLKKCRNRKCFMVHVQDILQKLNNFCKKYAKLICYECGTVKTTESRSNALNLNYRELAGKCYY